MELQAFAPLIHTLRTTTLKPGEVVNNTNGTKIKEGKIEVVDRLDVTAAGSLRTSREKIWFCQQDDLE